MAFKFPLATVLRVRTILEEREERMLQQIQQQISTTAQAIAEMNMKMSQSNASRISAVFQVSSGALVQASYGAFAQMMLDRKELEGRLDKLNRLRDIQIQAYNVARRNREMLTEMREEKRTAHDAVISAREQSALDDNFIARSRR